MSGVISPVSWPLGFVPTYTQWDAAFAVIPAAVANVAGLRASLTTTLGQTQCALLGYTNNADGGEGLFAVNTGDTTSADNGGTIIVDAAGRRWYRLTGGMPSSVLWFGATGNGTTDDTAAIQAAINFGKGVFFPSPSSTYKTTAPLVFSFAGHYVGAGLNTCSITNNSTTADIIQITGNGVFFSDVLVTSSVTKTAGSSINITGFDMDITRVSLNAFFYGITIGTSSVNPASIRIANSYVVNTAASGTQVGVLVLNGVDITLDNMVIEGGPSHNLSAGVLVENVGDVTLNRVSTVYAGNGLQISPGASQNVQVVFVNDSYFDTGSGYGIYVAPTASGAQVDVVKVTETWCVTNTGGGVGLNGTAGSTIQQFDAVNCLFANSAAGSGVALGYTGIGRATFVACSMSANTTGFNVSNGVLNFKLIGCVVGASGEFTANTGTGVQINGANDGFSITGNTVVGNGTQINFGGSPGTAGVTYFIAGNQGIVTNNYGVLVTTAGPTTFTITHGLFYTPLLEDITVTALSALGSAASFFPTTVTSTTFQITFNAAPGAGVNIGWRARIMGS